MAMVEFAQAYSEYLETQPVSYPTLSYPRLHALLLDCNRKNSTCASGCFACDENFFPILKKEVTAVSRYFNSRVRWLLRIHLASGVTKCIFRLKTKQARDYSAMVQEGQRLVKYVSMTTLATRKLLEKYDKVHTSTEGSKFRTWLMAVHVEALQSPWLVELLALYFNLKLNKARVAFPEICPGCVCDLQSVKPMLSCSLHESLRLEVDATCSICLEIVYEPVALKCGHIFCFKCACSAASVSTVNGFKKAKKSAKCPLCREPGVFANAFHLRELDMLINRRGSGWQSWSGWGLRRGNPASVHLLLKQILEEWLVKHCPLITRWYLLCIKLSPIQPNDTQHQTSMIMQQKEIFKICQKEAGFYVHFLWMLLCCRSQDF